MKTTHGGARKNSGRKTESHRHKTERINATVYEITVRKLKVLGKGNLSRGLRKAADIAYQQYQNESPGE